MKNVIMLFFMIVQCCCLFAQDSAISKQTEKSKIVLDDRNSLTKAEAEYLIETYRKKRYKRFKRLGIFGHKYDSRSCWFDIAKLSSFQNQLKSVIDERKNLGKDTGTIINGYRFYYITYEKNDKHAPKELKEALSKTRYNTKKIHSLLIVATQKMNNVDQDIIIEGRVAAVNIENQGTLCPPMPASSCSGALLFKN